MQSYYNVYIGDRLYMYSMWKSGKGKISVPGLLS